MKKLMFFVTITSLLFSVNTFAQATKYAEVVTGYFPENYVENQLPFGAQILEKNLFKPDIRASIYWTTVETAEAGIPGTTQAVIGLFQYGVKEGIDTTFALQDSIAKSKGTEAVIIVKVAIVDPLTDWSPDLQEGWEEYLDEKGFAALKKYKMGWVVGYDIVFKSEIKAEKPLPVKPFGG